MDRLLYKFEVRNHAGYLSITEYFTAPKEGVEYPYGIGYWPNHEPVNTNYDTFEEFSNRILELTLELNYTYIG